jgi:hypothetical protein
MPQDMNVKCSIAPVLHNFLKYIILELRSLYQRASTDMKQTVILTFNNSKNPVADKTDRKTVLK